MRSMTTKAIFGHLKFSVSFRLAAQCPSIARFLALVTTMVTKVDHGNYGWLPRLVTMVSYLGYQGANYGY